MPNAARISGNNSDLGTRLAEALRKAGWRPRRSSPKLFDAQGKAHVVELKIASEGRRDRLIPLLSQAILEARESAHSLPQRAIPIAVVAAKRIPASVAEQVVEFGRKHAPESGVGVIDAEGLRHFAGAGLEKLNTKPPRRILRQIAHGRGVPDLFTDLNQWMLKILVGQDLPESLISIPRGAIRNALHLAKTARVSVMSGSRLVNQLAAEGFLDKDEDRLHVVRTGELLERWLSANRPKSRDIAARWIVKQSEEQLLVRVAAVKAATRCCLGLFAAADALDLGFVRGVPPYLYLDCLDPDVLQSLGLTLENSDRRADVYLRVPADKESIFRAAVDRGGLPVSDVLQVWLDCFAHPARGREQSLEIRRRILKPLFGKHA